MKKTSLLALATFTLFSAATSMAQNITGSSTLGYVARFTNSSSTAPTAGSGLLYDNGTNWAGIGNTGPYSGELFSVQKSQNASTYMRIYNGTSGTSAGANYIANANGASLAMSAYSTGYTSSGIYQAGTGVINAANQINIGTNGSYPLTFWTNSTQQMILNSSGQLGINTPSPAYPLDVNGNIHVPAYSSFLSGTTTGSAPTYLNAGFDGVHSAISSIGTALLLNYNNTTAQDVAVCTGSAGGYLMTGKNVEIGSPVRDQYTALNLRTNGTTTALKITNSTNANIFNIDNAGNVSTSSTANIYFNGVGDLNHGLGVYGTNLNSATFAGKTINGPVLFGYGGGALGSTNGGAKVALQWDNTGAVTVPAVHSAASGAYNTVLVDVNGKLTTGPSVASTSSVGWALGGNASAGAALGTTDANSDLPIITANTEKMRLKANGDIRINTQGAFHTNGAQLYFDASDNYHGLGYFYQYTNAASKVFTIDGPVLYGYNGGALASSGGNIMALQWDGSGNVHIGQQSVTSGPHADALLTVSGKVACQEVRVFTNSSGTYWADYVFNKDYKLMPIKKVEDYYLANKHLPGVPTTDEIKEQGNDLAKTDAILLSKIEENTIYIVDLNKKLEKLAQENEELKALIKKLINK